MTEFLGNISIINEQLDGQKCANVDLGVLGVCGTTL